jgi:small nuclear ribonucleoprotein
LVLGYGGSPMVMPTKILENSMNKKISLLLKDSRILEGKLVGFDDYMNMVMENTEETFNDEVRRLGTIIIRGNNVVSISPQ